MAAISPYNTALALARPAPDWVPAKLDKDRVQAYDTYDDIWTNAEEAYAALLRVDDGGDIGRRYVAGARMLIEAKHRYLGRDLTWATSDPPGAELGEEAHAAALQALNDLFVREEFMSRFSALKRWMLIRGDGLFHLTADPLKPEGTRIRITELQPRSYFPIFDAVDQERVVGCYIVTLITEGKDARPVAAQRLEYHRVLTEDDVKAAPPGAGIGNVWYRLAFFELDGWDDRTPLSREDLRPVDVPASIPRTDAMAVLMQGALLPEGVSSLPVYHFRNRSRGSEAFGTSEIQGIETLLAGMSQTATDEDLTIGLAGIGVYVTDDDEPAEGEGDPVVAPASVIYLNQGRRFDRVPGVDTVQPLLDHYGLLKDAAQEATGVSEVAIGRVDVKVAESGIALALQMAPVISANQELELHLKAVLDHLVYDLLTGWLPGFEGFNAQGITVTASFGSALPLNRKEVMDEILALLTASPPLISAEYARQLLKERLGYDFPADMLAQIVAEQGAMMDAVGSRMDAELSAPPVQ